MRSVFYIRKPNFYKVIGCITVLQLTIWKISKKNLVNESKWKIQLLKLTKDTKSVIVCDLDETSHADKADDPNEPLKILESYVPNNLRGSFCERGWLSTVSSWEVT